mgnify:CR=1 FL=1
MSEDRLKNLIWFSELRSLLLKYGSNFADVDDRVEEIYLLTLRDFKK